MSGLLEHQPGRAAGPPEEGEQASEGDEDEEGAPRGGDRADPQLDQQDRGDEGSQVDPLPGHPQQSPFSSSLRSLQLLLSTENFFRTGFMADVVTHVLTLSLACFHARLHLSFDKLEEKIDYRFKNRGLLELALIHPSFKVSSPRPPLIEFSAKLRDDVGPCEECPADVWI